MQRMIVALAAAAFITSPAFAQNAVDANELDAATANQAGAGMAMTNGMMTNDMMANGMMMANDMAAAPEPMPLAGEAARPAEDDDRGGFPWGLIGLVGLIGLLGRKRSD